VDGPSPFEIDQHIDAAIVMQLVAGRQPEQRQLLHAKALGELVPMIRQRL